MAYELVVVGSSWGGFEALGQVLGGLPARFPAAVAIAQHRGAESDGTMAAALAARGPLPVEDVDDKAPVAAGRVYLAPADYHLLVERDGFALSVDERVHFSRPSADVLFESAADAYRERTVAVVLTGANADGAEGLRRVKRNGGYAIAQDPETAERPEMPAAAVATGVVDRVLALERIAPALVELCGGGA